MKLNFNKPPATKKEEVQQKKDAVTAYSNVARSADYNAKQQVVATSFGQGFKTGAHKDKKKESQKGYVKHKGKGFE